MAWFRRKRLGWGWTPSSWQGWAVTLLVGFACMALSDPHLVTLDKPTRIVCIAALVACLMAVAMVTRERDPET
jgi:hypothetical protein